MQEKNLREWLGMGGVERQQLRRTSLNPLLQVLPKSKPATVQDIPRAFILHPQFDELSPIREQLARFSAKIDGIICMHVWRLSGLEEAGSVVLMAVGRKPLAGPKKSALRPIGDEGTT